VSAAAGRDETVDEHSNDDGGSEIEARDLQDLAVIATPTTVPEAMYLADALQEAGVPAVSEPQHLDGLIPSNRVLVPRKFLEQAQAICEKARVQAEARGVDQAFDIENIAETTDEKQDPVMMRMFKLRAETPESRNEALVDFITKWLTQDSSVVQLAKYLAAAGLGRDEAQTLVDYTIQLQHETVEKSRTGKLRLGAVLLCISAIVTVLVAITLAAKPELMTQGEPLLAGIIGTGLPGLILIHRARLRTTGFPSSVELPADADNVPHDGGGTQ